MFMSSRHICTLESVHVIDHKFARLFNAQGRLVHVASGRVYNSVTNPPRDPGRDDITGCYNILLSFDFRLETCAGGVSVP